ncbi:hypothetical protein E2C01_032549 [Portunus trituberculatus]|uniref:Uncharacterized protein n=1 Tax=Portunus trituberculatus TaxID=210409 RepID=A0A5B7EVK0_PORTR|nr:hypothetical protein [Portunus trituberculatus]
MCVFCGPHRRPGLMYAESAWLALRAAGDPEADINSLLLDEQHVCCWRAKVNMSTRNGFRGQSH